MTKVIVKPASANPRIIIKSQGTQGPSGAYFRVVNTAAELIPSFGNNRDTAITIIDGFEYRKSNGIWAATGRRFWGTLLEDTSEMRDEAIAARDKSEAWAAYPEDMEVEDGKYSSLHYAAKAKVSDDSANEAADIVLENKPNIDAVAANKANINAAVANEANINAVVGNAININAVAANGADIDTVAANMPKVNTVAGIAPEVVTVAGIAANVTAVAGVAAAVPVVAAIDDDVVAVAANKANITAVANNKTNIDAVAGNKTNIDAVKNNETNINTVAANGTDIDTVAANIAAVSNVSGISGDVTAVSDIKANVSTVAGISTQVSIAADITDEIVAVAGNKANITNVANNEANVIVVANSTAKVATVADNIADVAAAADDMAAIKAAPAAADTATTKAGEADQSATDAINARNEALAVYANLAGGTNGQVLMKSGSTNFAFVWQDLSGGGDVFKAVIDPTGKNDDAYNMANFDEAVDALILRDAERAAITANTGARHSHTNKLVLDATTASFLTTDKTKLNGIAAGATANTGTVTSIGIVPPTGFAATPAITTSGTITISYAAGYQGYTTAEATKLSGIAAGAQVNPNMALYQLVSQKNAANGYAGLDASGKLLANQLPAIAITDTFVVASQAAMLALDVQVGDVAVRSDILKTFIVKSEPATVLANWVELATPTDAVQSVIGLTGPISQVQLRAALGLGTAAYASTGDFATAAEGALASSAVQPAAMDTALSSKLDRTAQAADSAKLDGKTPAELPISDAVQAALDAIPLPVPPPVSSVLPVGNSGLMWLTGGNADVSNNGTTAGSNLRILVINSTGSGELTIAAGGTTALFANASAALQTGTWKNISGVTVSSNASAQKARMGRFVRTL